MNETMTDRELDAWLAEHLFGEQVRWMNIERDHFDTVLDGSTFHCSGMGDCRYSSTGEGMLMVLEAMRERGYYYVLRCMDSLVRGNTRIGCTFEGDGLSGTGWIREADTAPRAVAEAAKAALEAEA